MNIPLGQTPAVDIVVVLLALLNIRAALMTRAVGPWRVAAWLTLAVVAILRARVDFPQYGSLALRDALFVPEIAAAFILGVAFASDERYKRLPTRLLDRLLAAISLWYALYPLRGLIVPLGPTVGLSKPVPLLDFTMTGAVGAVTLCYFLFRPIRPLVLLALFASAFDVLVGQLKGAYIGFVVALFLLLVARPQKASSSKRSGVLRAVAVLCVIGLCGLLLLPIAPQVQGRLGVLGLSTVTSQFQGLTGGDGLGAASANSRRVWFHLVIEEVQAQPGGELIGVGLGTDLIQGFESRTGTPVRKPHDDFLEVFGRFGLVGLVPFLVIYLSALWTILRLQRQNHPFAPVAVATVAVSTVLALTQPFFAFLYGTFPLFFVAGIAAVLGQEGVTGRSSARTP